MAPGLHNVSETYRTRLGEAVCAVDSMGFSEAVGEFAAVRGQASRAK